MCRKSLGVMVDYGSPYGLRLYDTLLSGRPKMPFREPDKDDWDDERYWFV